MKIMVYDDAERSYLRASWMLGALLYRARSVFDLVIPARSWEEAIGALYSAAPKTVDRLQFWGHGSPAAPYIASQRAPTQDLIDVLRSQMRGPRSIAWFRACNIATGDHGRTWCGHLAQAAGCRIAAHTFIVGPLQSGLRVALPDTAPTWSTTEGVNPDGSFAWSRWRAPRTVTMLTTDVPEGWTQ